MTEKRKPWMKFYPADWQADEGLRQCSLTARGLWIEMIAVMHKSSIYGHLLIAGFNPTEAQIAAQVSSDAKTVKASISELESWGVFSRTVDGVIYSRRMLEDAIKEKAHRENGSGGGNPALRVVPKRQDNEGVNPQVNQIRAAMDNRDDNQTENGGDKAQRLEARDQKKETPSLRSVPQKRRSQIDPRWEPDEGGQVKARECGIRDLRHEVTRFRDHHASKGSLMADWSAAWRTWCGNSQRFGKPQSRFSPGPRGALEVFGLVDADENLDEPRLIQ